MNYFERIARILNHCDKKKMTYSFQTNYGGKIGGHRLHIHIDPILFRSFAVYANREDTEKAMDDLEKELGLTDE